MTSSRGYLASGGGGWERDSRANSVRKMAVAFALLPSRTSASVRAMPISASCSAPSTCLLACNGDCSFASTAPSSCRSHHSCILLDCKCLSTIALRVVPRVHVPKLNLKLRSVVSGNSAE